jgi:hypothetical protein
MQASSRHKDNDCLAQTINKELSMTTSQLKALFIRVALSLLATTAQAATYYVAPNGNDTAPGSLTAPWLTIANAQSNITPGDTVYFRGGKYAYTAAITTCSSMTDIVRFAQVFCVRAKMKESRYSMAALAFICTTLPIK